MTRSSAFPIPWHEHATLIRTSAASIHDGGRSIVAEAPLHRIVEVLAALPPAELDRHYISLPDRQAAPFRFVGEAVHRLVGRIDRPGGLRVPVRQSR